MSVLYNHRLCLFFTLPLCFLFFNVAMAQVNFEEILLENNVRNACAIEAADMDEDGDIDIVAGGWDGGPLVWMENDGTGEYTTETISNNFGLRSLDVADYDNDGDMDIAAVCATSHSISWWRQELPGVFVQVEITTEFQNPHTIWAADMDDNNTMDLLVVGWNFPPLCFFNDGTGNFTPVEIGENDMADTGVEAIDMDGDDDLDVVTGDFTSGNIYWLEQLEDHSFTSHHVSSTYNSGHWLSAGDMDGDGDIDVVGACYASGNVYLYTNEVSFIFTSRQIWDSAGASWIRTVDVDRDGDLDVYVSAEISDDIAWLENNGQAQFTEHILSNNFDRVMGGDACDLDGDEDIDLLSAAVDANELRCWINLQNDVQILALEASPPYIEPETGVTTLLAELNNPFAHETTVTVTVQDHDNAEWTETVELFDDGAHNDGEANDNLFAVSWTAPENERIFDITGCATDINNDVERMYDSGDMFTTAGPVVCQSYEITQGELIPGGDFSVQLTLCNEGLDYSLTGVGAALICLHPDVMFASDTNRVTRYFAELTPGGTSVNNTPYNLVIGETCPEGDVIPFAIEFTWWGHHFYDGELIIPMAGSAVDQEPHSMPSSDILMTAYPNPCNGETCVTVFLSHPFAHGKISIFNLLGQEIWSQTLLHSTTNEVDIRIPFDGFASGTYLCVLNLDEHLAATRRILYLK